MAPSKPMFLLKNHSDMVKQPPLAFGSKFIDIIWRSPYRASCIWLADIPLSLWVVALRAKFSQQDTSKRLRRCHETKLKTQSALRNSIFYVNEEKKSMKKLYLAMVALIIASMILAACGPAETEAPATQAPTEVMTEAPLKR
jgi:hypothetical protein